MKTNLQKGGIKMETRYKTKFQNACQAEGEYSKDKRNLEGGLYVQMILLSPWELKA